MISNHKSQCKTIICIFLAATLFGSSTLFANPGKAIEASPNGFASLLCEEFFASITEPMFDCLNPTRKPDFSSSKDYARKSAALIEYTLGVKIKFNRFHHLPFSVQCRDRLVIGNFFAFEFEKVSQLQSLMKLIPVKRGGTYGSLRTKSPQRYELRMIGPVLIVLAINGFRRDDVVEKLFDKFQHVVLPLPK